LLEATKGLRRITDSRAIGDALAMLDDVFDGHTSLVGSEGGLVAGAAIEPPLTERDRIAVQIGSSAGAVQRLIQPIVLVSGEPPSFWLVLSRRSPTQMWAEAAAAVLQIVASYFAVRLISERLANEQDARFRLGLLHAIIAASDQPEATLLHRISLLGWEVDGWSTAVHISVSGEMDQLRLLSLTGELAKILSEVGLRGPLIERPDGWTTWLSDKREPSASSFMPTTNNVRDALRRFCSGRPTIRVYAGVGRPYAKLSGLRKSLAEAHEASTIAHAGGGRTATQHIDELGIERILFGWYASPDFADFASILLGPLLRTDRNDELLHTLETFLDNESSPSVTAEVLGIHRNTVLNRMDRIRERLSVDLEQPDQRLAVQLGCRVAKLQSGESP
jgi:hypothetical protein